MKKYFILLFTLTLFMNSCLDEPGVNPIDSENAELTAMLLTYIDATGVIRSNGGEVELVDAFTLYSNPENYHIIDIRPEQEYLDGHIAGAVHQPAINVLTYLENLVPDSSVKKIIVSRNGFEASYVYALSLLYGINDVCVLKFGVAGWNSELSPDWNENINTYYPSPNYRLLTLPYAALPHSPLPSLQELSGATVENKLKNRVRSLIEEQTNLSPVENFETVFYHFENLYDYYSEPTQSFHDIFILCYGSINVYNLYGSQNAEYPAHPPETRMIEPPLKTNYALDSYILTIPSDKPVYIYSSDGHDSAFLAAILNVLGYDAHSMLFGAQSFGYNGFIWTLDAETRSRAYLPRNVLNLPYEVETEP